jgi:ferric-dicitrate binding protein FerR (iron transport regulator)
MPEPMNVDEEYLRKIIQLFNEPDNDILRKEVDTLRASSDAHDAFYQEVLKLWNTSAEIKALETISVTEATERLSVRLRDTQPRVSEEQTQATPLYKWFLRAAAVVVAGMVGYWLFPREENYLSKQTALGVNDSIRLSDGSTVFMDELTQVQYPEQWKGGKRRVRLEQGNAFFSVTRDTERPFIVQLDESSVTVLGTSFNISANAEEIAVSVKTGTVVFETGTAAGKSVLSAGRGVVYRRNSGTLKAVDVTNSNADAWLTHELKFADASLQEVLESLEQYYKVHISVEDSIANFKKFNASFRNNDINQVLDVLEATYPIRVEHKDANVIIRGHPSPR